MLKVFIVLIIYMSIIKTYDEFTEPTNLLNFSIGVTAFVLGSIIYYVLLQREMKRYN